MIPGDSEKSGDTGGYYYIDGSGNSGESGNFAVSGKSDGSVVFW